MSAPLMSTITLVSELFVTAGILTVFWYGYFRNRFLTKLAFAVLAYEILINVTYMISRVVTHVDVKTPTPVEIALLAFHGILSLIMLFAIIAVLVLAYLAHLKRRNFFRQHPVLTAVVVTVWLISILSGLVVYVMEYVFNV